MVFRGCAKLFGVYLGVISEVFVKDFEGETIQRVKEKIQKLYFLLFKIAPNSLFIEGGVCEKPPPPKKSPGQDGG